jgi:hypothetical protein
VSWRIGNSIRIRSQTDFENLRDRQDISKAWRNIKENIKTAATGSLGLSELKQHKPWFDGRMLRISRSVEAG